MSSKIPRSNAIEWRHIDPKKFYALGPTIFIGIRGLLYPPQLIKTRLQVQTQHNVYRGVWDAFKNIVRLEGVRGLYKGFWPNAFGVIAGQMYITSYEVIRNSLRDYSPTTRGLVAGGVASLVGQSIGVPIDIVSQRLMMEGQQSHNTTSNAQPQVLKKPKRKPIRNTSKMIVHVYHTHGLRGFFHGYWAAILTFGPTSTIWWGMYSTTTAWAISRKPEQIPLEVVQCFCGAISGFTAGILCNPMDVVRTRLQVLGGRSMVKVFRQLYVEEGWTMVYKGLSARLMAMVPSSCLIVVAYEMVKRLSLRSDIQLTDLYGY